MSTSPHPDNAIMGVFAQDCSDGQLLQFGTHGRYAVRGTPGECDKLRFWQIPEPRSFTVIFPIHPNMATLRTTIGQHSRITDKR